MVKTDNVDVFLNFIKQVEANKFPYVLYSTKNSFSAFQISGNEPPTTTILCYALISAFSEVYFSVQIPFGSEAEVENKLTPFSAQLCNSISFDNGTILIN